MSDNESSDGGLVTQTRTKPKEKLKRPAMYRVLLHNDDYTTREFVVSVLRSVFRKSEGEAVQVMMHVHNNGVGLAGTYTYEVAEMKVRSVEALAARHEFPLMLTIEPEE